MLEDESLAAFVSLRLKQNTFQSEVHKLCQILLQRSCIFCTDIERTIPITLFNFAFVQILCFERKNSDRKVLGPFFF